MPQNPGEFFAIGSIASALNLTSATVIKATPGRLAKFIITGSAVGTGGTLTFNDCTTTGAAAVSNQIYSVAGTIALGSVITLDWPCANGIVLSSFPTGGTGLNVTVSYM